MNTLASVLVLCAMGVVGDLPDKDVPPNYYPLEEGTKLHLSGDVNGNTINMVMHVVKLEDIDGKRMARVECSLNGNVVSTEHMLNDSKGLFRCRTNGAEVVPPVCVIKYPVKEGAEWKSSHQMGGQKVEMVSRIEKLEEEIEVPAGKYKAMRVKATGDVAGQKIETTYWLAKDVGIVKQAVNLGVGEFAVELDKFEKGK